MPCRERRLRRRIRTDAGRHPAGHVRAHVAEHARGRHEGRRGLPAPRGAAGARAAEGGGQQAAQGLRARRDDGGGRQGGCAGREGAPPRCPRVCAAVARPRHRRQHARAAAGHRGG